MQKQKDSERNRGRPAQTNTETEEKRDREREKERDKEKERERNQDNMFGEQEKCLKRRKGKKLEFQRDRCNSFYRWGYEEVMEEMALEKVISQK